MAGFTLQQQVDHVTLWKVRREGHPYLEFRFHGGKLIFFCVLCLAPCYGKTPMLEHLSGRAHRKKYAYAELTLLGPNPWPFNDGIFFFCNPSGQDLESLDMYNDRFLNTDVKNEDFVRGHKMSNLEAKFVGFAQMGARTYENVPFIDRIWFSWLGKRNSGEEDESMFLPPHDVGIITFSYNYNLGREPAVRDLDRIVASDTCLEIENDQGNSKRIKEDKSQVSTDQCNSSVEDNQMSGSDDLEIVSADSYKYNLGHEPASDTCLGIENGQGNSKSMDEDKSQVLTEQCNSSVEDNQIPRSDDLEVVSADKLQKSKSKEKRYRRQMKEEKRVASLRKCEICRIRMLHGKDVACLVNMKTGRLACSSKNTTGAFHIFHTSCLLHWILTCEVEIRENSEATPKKISSVFCPECYGTGINVEDKLEESSFSDTDMLFYKMKSRGGQSDWLKSPEILQNCCSVGLHFPPNTEGLTEAQVANLKFQEQVVDMKLLSFFRAGV